MATANEQVCEAEALIGALIEEIEEVTDDVREAKALSQDPNADESNGKNDDILRGGLLDLLKTSGSTYSLFCDLVTPNPPIEYRAMDAPPLVLLDDADILAELRSVVSRASVSELEEVEWSSHLTGQLSALFVLMSTSVC